MLNVLYKYIKFSLVNILIVLIIISFIIYK